jgi:hypothetical protein
MRERKGSPARETEGSLQRSAFGDVGSDEACQPSPATACGTAARATAAGNPRAVSLAGGGAALHVVQPRPRSPDTPGNACAGGRLQGLVWTLAEIVVVLDRGGWRAEMSKRRTALISIGTAHCALGLLGYEYWGRTIGYPLDARLEIAAGLALVVAGCLYRGRPSS